LQPPRSLLRRLQQNRNFGMSAALVCRLPSRIISISFTATNSPPFFPALTYASPSSPHRSILCRCCCYHRRVNRSLPQKNRNSKHSFLPSRFVLQIKSSAALFSLQHSLVTIYRFIGINCHPCVAHLTPNSDSG
jgi:hypothetical protein